jgi:primase-polymerase (primpol)-like protein
MNNKPETYNADLAHLPMALMPLTEQPRWVTWRWEYVETKKKGGRWTKPPYQTLEPNQHAKSTDSSTWGKHEDAAGAVAAGAADGIGFMLLGADVGAGDLDHCRDPKPARSKAGLEKTADEAHSNSGL